MATCFVIQPFDSGKYDKRFEQVYKPAILAAGLEAYRVDQDNRVDVPIDAIESGIRDAAVCLADITTDNPNVWYELGFAFASGQSVVMVCSADREGGKYPFDIQHRSVISYTSEAPGDFDTLRDKITERIRGSREKGVTLQQLAKSEQIAPLAGLSSNEMIVLTAVAANAGTSEGRVGTWSVQRDTERVGLNSLGFALSVRRLKAKRLLEATQDADYNGNSFDALLVTEAGWDWIEENESLFVLRRVTEAKRSYTALSDEDIPF